MEAKKTNKKLILCVLILLSFGIETIMTLDPLPQVPTNLLFLNRDQLYATKQKAKADQTLAERTNIDQLTRWCTVPSPIPTVMLKSQAPISRDMHDYFSLAPYYWPNLSKPYPHEPYYSRDGYKNPEIETITDATQFSRMLGNVVTCSNAYLFTADLAHANKALQMIRTWFINDDTKMNPNLKYSQVIKGLFGSTDGTGSGFIELYRLWKLYDIIKILKTTPLFTSQDDAALTKWFSSMLDYYTTSSQAKAVQGFKNCHVTYFNLNVVAMANFLNKPDIWEKHLDSTLTRMDSQIMKDGTMPYEASRSNSFSYYVYAIESYLVTAHMAKNLNYPVNFYTYVSPRGGSIRKVIDLLITYATVPNSMPGSNLVAIDTSTLVNSLIVSGLNIDAKYLMIAKTLPGFDVAYAYYTTTGTFRIS